GGSGVRHVLVRLRGERHGSRYLDRDRPSQRRVGRVRKRVMSKLRLGLLVTTAMAVIAAIAGGCSKPTPTAPGQGTPTDDRLMMFGFQDQDIPSVVFVTVPKD